MRRTDKKECKCSKFLRIVQEWLCILQTDQKWIPKSVYCIRCAVVCKIVTTNWSAKIALLRASVVITYYIKRVFIWQLETQLFAWWTFDWCTFSRQVTARWWRQWVKNQVLTNQNSRNMWCLIVRRSICKLFQNEGRQTQRYFNVSTPFSRREN